MGGMMNETAVVRRTGKDAISDFLSRKTLYDVMRQSGKVVVFDTSIPVQLAFYALLEHDMAAAPLWDSGSRRFVGLMSVTDFIDILRHYHRRGIPMDELSARTIGEVMSDPDGRPLQHSTFVGNPVTASVRNAVNQLVAHKHRFLPVLPPASPSEVRVLAVLSYYDTLRYLVDTFREQRRLFEDPVADLGVGTYGAGQVVTVATSAKLAQVLDLLEQRDVSAVPVVDETGRVVDIYPRSDITFLATATDAESVLSNLELSMSEVLALRVGELELKDRLHTCSPRATLQSVFELFSEVGFRRLVAVDDTTGACLGVITARDLILYFCQ